MKSKIYMYSTESKNLTIVASLRDRDALFVDARRQKRGSQFYRCLGLGKSISFILGHPYRDDNILMSTLPVQKYQFFSKLSQSETVRKTSAVLAEQEFVFFRQVFFQKRPKATPTHLNPNNLTAIPYEGWTS